VLNRKLFVGENTCHFTLHAFTGNIGIYLTGFVVL